MNNLEITSAYVGSDQVVKLYLGGEAIWPSSTPPVPTIPDWLRMDITGDGYINWKSNDNRAEPTRQLAIEYSKDSGQTWTTIQATTADTHIDVYSGETVWFRGNNPAYGTGTASTIISSTMASTFSGSTAQFKLAGELMSLCFGDDFAQHSRACTEPYQFANLFRACTGLTDASELKISHYCSTCCYVNMFNNCKNLRTAPQFMLDEGYNTVAPSGCCSGMFQYCSGLTTAPTIYFNDISARYALTFMFQGCSNLHYIKVMCTTASSQDSFTTGVPQHGTFVKAPNAEGWTIGNAGIPSGWTVVFAPGFGATDMTVYESGATTNETVKWESYLDEIPDTTAFSASSLITNISYSNGYITFDTLANTGFNQTITIEAPSSGGYVSTLNIYKMGELGINWVDFANWLPSHTSADTLGDTVAIKQGGSSIWTYTSPGYLTDVSGITDTTSGSTGILYTGRTTFKLNRANPYYSLKPIGTTALTEATPVRTEVIGGNTYNVYDLTKDMYISANNTRFSTQITSGEMFIELDKPDALNT